ncbi:hypothetical protein BC937DRAFT_90505 [Endogone sp. FLAS-F59071]|nr:hypothetical protein BC937DRAFT_90505 [Endogone sp. FLAS-F59071]|eukprot:RUS17041.1 hypothetical protein BC937DRAFT_90505 [Endogone sp. FLAS-F59071]
MARKLVKLLDITAKSTDTFPESLLGRKVSFWCFSPGLAMKDIMDQGVRSVILASGTLSPLESFASEFHM